MARGSSGKLKKLLILLVLLGLVFVGIAAFRIGPAPAISLESDLPGIGDRTTVQVRVQEPKRGLGDVRVEFVQGEREEVLAEKAYAPLPPWKFWGERTGSDAFEVVVGRQTIDKLKEGDAEVRVSASRAASWLRRPAPATVSLNLPVKLRPPSIQVMSTHTYVRQGGSEAVVYRVGESAVKDGVRAGEWFFPGYAMPGRDERTRFALFAAPYDMDDSSLVRLIAVDDVGNEASVSIVDRFTPEPIRRDTIRINDKFMSRVVPAILSHTPELEDKGDLLQNYLQINNDLRQQNAATILELAGRSEPAFHWNRRFLQLPNSAVTSAFADRRTYVYEGSDVDRQDHLGFDLASVSRADVPAANSGVVLMARYFGIYGNAVLIDHGYGLQSLYGHLSTIRVEEGQKVERGEVIGRTGDTGLAGGDHLHFTMLLHGLPVNPREWWDAHWIHDRIKLKLEDAFPFREK